MNRLTVLISVILVAWPCAGQGIVNLGTNPETGLQEIRVNLPGLPESATPLDMALIPAGKFLMGAAEGEKGAWPFLEGPQHEVTLTHPFYLGKYEVTQAQWELFMDYDPTVFPGNPNRPVDTLHWGECQPFIDKLNALNLGTFRLPTEAEWEYACRAGTTTRFYWGDDPDDTLIDQYAWYTGNSNGESHDVGQKLPNPWGLYDMNGNVCEWCSNLFMVYTEKPEVDPQGPSEAGGRAFRGGYWHSTHGTRRMRSAHRPPVPDGHRSGRIGMRLARTYEASPVDNWELYP